jgi:SepF-like predicted cell division protein (DUF552 family)
MKSNNVLIDIQRLERRRVSKSYIARQYLHMQTPSKGKIYSSHKRKSIITSTGTILIRLEHLREEGGGVSNCL